MARRRWPTSRHSAAAKRRHTASRSISGSRTWIQQARGPFDGVVINPGAYSHTSVAIHDALRLLDVPIVEVHLSNIHARESFRHHSFVSPVATGVICGLGPEGYRLAIIALAGKFEG
jgi:3-dehydroquinate dehydratase-2